MAAGDEKDCADRRRRYCYSTESRRHYGYSPESRQKSRRNSDRRNLRRNSDRQRVRYSPRSGPRREERDEDDLFAVYSAAVKGLPALDTLEDDEDDIAYRGYMERRRENEERKHRREAVAQRTGVKPLDRRGPSPDSLFVKSSLRRHWRNFPLDAERGRRWQEEERKTGLLGRRDHGQPDRRVASGRKTTENRVLPAAGDSRNDGSEATDQASKESIPLSPLDAAIPCEANVGGAATLVKAEVPCSAQMAALFDNVCVLKTVRGILSKLTPEKFGILKGQLIQSGMTSADILKLSEELPEQEIRDKDSLLKLLRLVGLLFKEKMVPEETVHDTVKELLGADPKSCPAEEKVEAICQLFRTIGPELDRNPESRRKNDEYFKRLEDLSTNPQLAPCSRSIHDILALRKWYLIRQDEKPFANWDLPRGDGAMLQPAARFLPPLPSSSPSLNQSQPLGTGGLTSGALLQGAAATVCSPQDYRTHPTPLQASAPAPQPAAAVVEKSQPADVKLSTTELRCKTNSLLQKYFSRRDLKEALACVEKLKSPSYHSEVVKHAVSLGLENIPPLVELVVKLVEYLFKNEIVSHEDVFDGLLGFAALLDDVGIKLPKAPTNFGEILGRLVLSGALTSEAFFKILKKVTNDDYQKAVNSSAMILSSSPAAKSADKGEGITIAIIDSGILRDHHEFTAFDDKVISENVYIEEWAVNDTKGHGSHVASIAAGRICSFAPLSRLRIYKVSDTNMHQYDDNFDFSFSRAMYYAIQKEVDVICISLGDDCEKDFEENLIALWTCRAAMKGTVVCCSAGNQSKDALENVPPWCITCGAAWKDDERFEARVELGDQNTLYGHSIYRPPNFSSTRYYKLEYFRPTSWERLAKEIRKRGRNCVTDSIVVLHDHRHISLSWKLLESYGACGLILINDKGDKSVHCEATINIPYGEGNILIAYMNSTKCSSSKSPSRLTPATARITFSTEKSMAAKLMVSEFSSRGPCPKEVAFDTFGVFKPDVLGLGDHILGAFHRHGKKYVWKSGTSMATPHVVAVVAIIKAFHPTWLPERIKSAIMTTAIYLGIIDEYDGLPARVFAMGCGLVNLDKALDPGLVYDSIATEYIPAYLRGLKYSEYKMGRLLGKEPVGNAVLLAHNLNYPAFAIQFSATGSALGMKIRCERIVTNVGEAYSSYEVDSDPPRGVKVHVEPSVLIFSPGTTTHKYTVEFELLENLADGRSDGSITWKNSKHSVRSPIAVLQQDAQVQHQKHKVKEARKKARYHSAHEEEDTVPLPFQQDELPNSAHKEEDTVPLPFQQDELPNCCTEDDTYLEAIIAKIGSPPSDPKDEVEYIKSLIAHLQLPAPDTLEDDDDDTVYWEYMDSLEPSDYRLSDWSDLEPMWVELQKPLEEKNKNGEPKPEPSPGCQYFNKPVYPDPDCLRSYCVQLEIPDSLPQDIEAWYQTFFPTDLDSTPEDKRPRMITACDPDIHCGFFAKLSPKHVEYMKTMPHFMDAQEEGPFQFHLID